MAPLGEVSSLLIYSAQQLGVMLGVGAQTVILAALLVGMHAHTTGDLFVRAARHARGVGLFFIIVSGLAAVGLHLAANAYEVLLAPAFLFKWLLVVVVLVLHVIDRFEWWREKVEGLAGASWYAIFLVHTLAPITTWADLIILYAGWTVVFMLVWTAFGYVMNRVSKVAPVRAAVTPAAVVSTPVLAPVAKKNKSSAPKPVAASASVVKPAAAPAIKVVAPVSTPKPVVVAPVPAEPPIKIVTPPPPVKPVIHTPVPAALQVTKPPVATPPVAQPHPLVPAKHPMQLTAHIPVVPKPTLTHTVPPVAPVPEQKNFLSLPIIRIMPQKPEDIHPDHGSAVVHLTPKSA